MVLGRNRCSQIWHTHFGLQVTIHNDPLTIYKIELKNFEKLVTLKVAVDIVDLMVLHGPFVTSL
jgi:hypothetical protein